VFIRHFDEVSFSEEYENCAYDDVTMLSTRRCIIPIAHLCGNPYNLGWGQEVYAKISAINIVGESEASLEGNGARVLTSPDKPLNLKNVASQTTSTQIGLTWQEGLSYGGSPVIDYTLTWGEVDGVYTSS
jgi:hypothetical protein